MLKKIIIFTIIFIILSLSANANNKETDKIRAIEIMFSIPYVNSFYSKPEGENIKSGIGYWGLSGAIGYKYSSNKSIIVVASSQIEYEIPVPMGIDYEDGIVENHNSSNISIISNYEVKDFVFGYGLSYSWFTWRIRYFGDDYIPPDQIGKTISNESIGINLNLHYRIGNHFNIGLIYRPDFIMIDPNSKIHYQHSISLDIGWRWRIKL